MLKTLAEIRAEIKRERDAAIDAAVAAFRRHLEEEEEKQWPMALRDINEETEH